MDRLHVALFILLGLFGCWGFVPSLKPSQLSPAPVTTSNTDRLVEGSLAQLTKDVASIAAALRLWRQQQEGGTTTPNHARGIASPSDGGSNLGGGSNPVLGQPQSPTAVIPSSPPVKVWYIPTNNSVLGKTARGLQLWNYELPFTSGGGAVSSVLLVKNWTALSRQEQLNQAKVRKAIGSITAGRLWRPPSTQQVTDDSHGGEGVPHAVVSIESIDNRIRLRGDTGKCRKLSDPTEKGECYHKSFAESQNRLETVVTTALQPLAWSISIPSNTRRFYMDIGARDWASGSTKWFMNHYPGSKLFHASSFEMDKRFKPTFPQETLNAHFTPGWEFVNAAVWIHADGVQWTGNDMGAVVDKSGAAGAGLTKNLGGPTVADGSVKIESIDFSAYIEEKFTMEDFVVVKMDIEGAEWPIMQRLIDMGTIKYIDEMFFECHVSEPSDVMHSRCIDIMNLLRSMGVVCHRWI